MEETEKFHYFIYIIFFKMCYLRMVSLTEIIVAVIKE